MRVGDFTPAVPGSWTWSRLDMDAATHEAGHGVAAVLLGVPLRELRIDRPEPHMLGLANTTAVTTPAGLERQLALVLAGPLAVGQPIVWPPRRGADRDEHAAGVLADSLVLDENGWRRVERLTGEMLQTQAARAAIRAVAGELLERGALPGERVRELTQLPGGEPGGAAP